MCTFSAVLETLETIIDGNDRERAVEASGILNGLHSFSFVVSLVIFKKVFGITAQLSDALQSESLDIGHAANLVLATIDTFEDMRSDDKWELLWEEAVAFSEKHGISMSLPVHTRRTPRQTQLPSRLSDSIVTDTVGHTVNNQCSRDYKRNVYFSSLDVILQEMKERFSTESISLMKAIDSLRPTSKTFLDSNLLEPLLSHYRNVIPSGSIVNEIDTFKHYLRRNPLQPQEDQIHDVLDRIKPMKDAFPLLTSSLMIAMTIGTC